MGDKCNIISNINLYKLWNNDLSDNTRENIWKYLFTLYLYSYCSIKNISIGKLIKKTKSLDTNNIPENYRIIYSIIDNLYNEKRINKLVKKEKNQLANSSKSNPLLENLGNLGNLNIGDNIINGEIGKLAKEIAGEINPENFKKELDNKDPQELLGSILSGNLDNN